MFSRHHRTKCEALLKTRASKRAPISSQVRENLHARRVFMSAEGREAYYTRQMRRMIRAA
jgi:hypothetical protein